MYLFEKKIEKLQFNLRSLENVNNEREMPQDDNINVSSLQPHSNLSRILTHTLI